MKLCPNPNCILYTRLEELPDAYTRCPGCGGQLVDASMPSGKLHSGYLTRLPGGGLTDQDVDEEEPAEGPVQQAPAFVAPSAPPAQPQYDNEYYPYEDTEQDESVQIQPAGITRGARIAYILALLLLLFSCALFFAVIGTRFLSPSSITPADATETAIVALRPAVNTPVPIMPTVPQSSLPPDQATPTTQPEHAPPPTFTPQPEPPTITPLPQPASATAPPPTQVQLPPTQAPLLPTATSAPQPQSAPPTAPPAQQQPTGGVTNAQMVTDVAAGQAAGNVSAYHAGDTFTLVVQASFGPGGVTTMKTHWYGPDNALLYEIPRDFTTQGTYYTAFTLKKDTPWATGDYRVDIYTNNSPAPAYTVTFSVVP